MSISAEPIVIGHRYELQRVLGRGGMGVVHRAVDRLTNEVIALKRVMPIGGDTHLGSPTDEDVRLTLTQEFKVLAGLRHPNIISVLDYGFETEGWPYFTMEFLDRAINIREAARYQTIEFKLGLIGQVLQAITYLHRCGILHRDLKPENILTVNDRVKVLDFGLSILREKADESETSGTLAYIAPEILRGHTASEASDLYAVGVIAYEIIAGEHPFYKGDTTRLIHSILNEMPDFPQLDVGEGVSSVIQHLLVKEPENRYQDSVVVIHDLNKATPSINIAIETAETRESFLQSAPFTGRQAELTRLINEMNGALEGRGKALLLGGESGVGKSRLLDELRTHAMVKGLLVMRGQDVRESAQPYHIWRSVVRRLCLMNNLTDFQISILKPIVPDIQALLKRTVPDAPQLDSGSAQDRLFITVEEMFRKNQAPTLVLLEDLHWTDNASLLLLNRLNRVVADHPLILVGTYRDDERPALSDNLSWMQTIHLSRLGDDSIRQLAATMLGKAARNQNVIQLLKNESSGNVFFLVEVVRTLAEYSGELANIGATVLPDKIFAGGMRDIIRHRLSRVPESAQMLLRLAAVAGQQLDLDVLKAIEPTANFNFWLDSCAASAILEVEDDRWRFSHSKLRDGLLEDLSAEEVKDLHRRVALAKEQVNPEGKGQYAALGLHWESAGDLARAAGWYHKAGKEAETAYSPEAAIDYYEKALKFYPDDKKFTVQRLEIFHGLGKMLRWQARFDLAVDRLNMMLKASVNTQDKVNQARAYIGLGDVAASQGKREEALDYAEKAVSVAREAGENGQAELVEALGNKAAALNRLKKRPEALDIAQEALELATRLSIHSQMARLLNILGMVSFFLGKPDESIRYFERALAISRELGDKNDIAGKLNNLGDVYRMTGQFSQASTHYEDALTVFREIGNRENELVLLTNLGSLKVEMDDFATAEAHLRQVDELTYGSQWWGLGDAYVSMTKALMGQHKTGGAMVWAQKALAQGRKMNEPETMGKAWRLLGRIADKMGIPMFMDGRDYKAGDCFQESLNIFTDESAERGYSLHAWSIHEMNNNNQDLSNQLWTEAEALFVKLQMPDAMSQLR